MKTSVVYLIHFQPALRHAKHYLGSCSNLPARIQEHLAGRGARICEVAVSHGIKLVVVRTWSGSKRTERSLKNLKNSPQLCPLCNSQLKPSNAIKLK